LEEALKSFASLREDMVRAPLIIALLALLLPSPIFASPPPKKPPAQILLNAPLIEHFIASYKPVAVLGKRYDAQWDKERLADPKTDALREMKDNLEAKGAIREFDALVGQYGFSSFSAWLIVYYSTAMAYGFADPKNDLPQLEARLVGALAGIQNNPNLTDEDKAKYTAAAREFLASYIALRPPAGNIEAVRPYQAQLQALLGSADGKP
jgi:hypothetical protein